LFDDGDKPVELYAFGNHTQCTFFRTVVDLLLFVLVRKDIVIFLNQVDALKLYTLEKVAH